MNASGGVSLGLVSTATVGGLAATIQVTLALRSLRCRFGLALRSLRCRFGLALALRACCRFGRRLIEIRDVYRY